MRSYRHLNGRGSAFEAESPPNSMYSKRKQAVTRRVLTWLNSRHWSHRTAIALIYWLARLFLPSCCRQGYRRTAPRLRNCLGIWNPRYCCAVQTLPKLKGRKRGGEGKGLDLRVDSGG